MKQVIKPLFTKKNDYWQSLRQMSLKLDFSRTSIIIAII